MVAKKKKILICEDERALSKALELKLSHEGYDVVVTATGEEALDTIWREKFSLLLLDLVLPQKDGFAVLEELKKAGNKVPIIVTSNLGQDEDKKRVTDLGVSQYLIKSNTPINIMVETVKEILENKK